MPLNESTVKEPSAERPRSTSSTVNATRERLAQFALATRSAGRKFVSSAAPLAGKTPVTARLRSTRVLTRTRTTTGTNQRLLSICETRDVRAAYSRRHIGFTAVRQEVQHRYEHAVPIQRPCRSLRYPGRTPARIATRAQTVGSVREFFYDSLVCYGVACRRLSV